MAPDGLEQMAALGGAVGGNANTFPTYRRKPQNAFEALVAGFVDGQGASSCLPIVRLCWNRTINGLVYAADVATLRQLEGFAAMGHSVTDDVGIAQLFAAHGPPIAQTAVTARVAVTFYCPVEALRLLGR